MVTLYGWQRRGCAQYMRAGMREDARQVQGKEVADTAYGARRVAARSAARAACSSQRAAAALLRAITLAGSGGSAGRRAAARAR